MSKIYKHKFNAENFTITLIANDQNLLLIDINSEDKYDENSDFFEEANEIIKEAKRQLLEYLQGKRKKFDITKLKILDKSERFERKVYAALMDVEYGETITYKQLGEKAGILNAARAVGNAMAKNPFPIIVPCHRVVKSDGKIGNYTGGSDVKISLLDIEKKFKE